MLYVIYHVYRTMIGQARQFNINYKNKMLDENKRYHKNIQKQKEEHQAKADKKK